MYSRELLLPALRKNRPGTGAIGTFPDAWFERRRDRAFTVGLLVPTTGSAGIWGPSTIACAQLAAEEINRGGGLLGQEVRLRVVDAADEIPDLAEQTQHILDEGEIDAIVGMHISAVRQNLRGAVAGRVPYVYTPLYEGGERTPGIYAIGETPRQQLRPAIRALAERFHLKRWALLGNDYVWPRLSHARVPLFAGRAVTTISSIPLGVTDFGPVLERLARLKADALLLSLV
jgi:ABC-type branched-subunit amino acid transport system substrate-binding protein